MSHALALSRGVKTIKCPACNKEFKIDSKKIKTISETRYFGGHVCHTQELFTCPRCNKKVLTKKKLRLHAGYGIIPDEKVIIGRIKELKKEYPKVWFRDIVKGAVIYDDTKIPQKFFDEAERNGYAIIK